VSFSLCLLFAVWERSWWALEDVEVAVPVGEEVRVIIGRDESEGGFGARRGTMLLEAGLQKPVSACSADKRRRRTERRRRTTCRSGHPRSAGPRAGARGRTRTWASGRCGVCTECDAGPWWTMPCGNASLLAGGVDWLLLLEMEIVSKRDEVRMGKRCDRITVRWSDETSARCRVRTN